MFVADEHDLPGRSRLSGSRSAVAPKPNIATNSRRVSRLCVIGPASPSRLFPGDLLSVAVRCPTRSKCCRVPCPVPTLVPCPVLSPNGARFYSPGRSAAQTWDLRNPIDCSPSPNGARQIRIVVLANRWHLIARGCLGPSGLCAVDDVSRTRVCGGPPPRALESRPFRAQRRLPLLGLFSFLLFDLSRPVFRPEGAVRCRTRGPRIRVPCPVPTLSLEMVRSSIPLRRPFGGAVPGPRSDASLRRSGT